MTGDWFKKYLSSDDIKTIEQKIAEVESKLDIEIVPVIVRQSIVAGHVQVILFLLLTLLLALYFIVFRNYYESVHILFGFFVLLPFCWFLSFVFSKYDFVKEWFTLDNDEWPQVYSRALFEFNQHKLASTEKRNCLLVFVSVVERKAVLLPDIGIEGLFHREQCAEILGEFSKCLKQMQWKKAYIDLLGRVEQVAMTDKKLLNPRKNNELKDHFRVLN